MKENPLQRPERRYEPPDEDAPLFPPLADPRNDMSRAELLEWMRHQRGVIALLEKLLDNETRKLAEVVNRFGPAGEDFDPELTYRRIRELGRLQGAATDYRSGYEQEWTWKEKILYIVGRHRRPMKLRDIVKAYRFLDDNAEYVHDLNNTISVNLRQLKRSGRLVHHKPPGGRVGSYVCPEWLDENGRLLPGFNGDSGD